MKISICIPQYNRAALLVKSLRMIEKQTYDNLEIVISDDCSSDDTVNQIQELKKSYKYPVILHVNEKNTGYDRNYRKCIELCTGDYAFVIGNDDSIFNPEDMEYLANFLEENNYPDIGYCNYVEDKDKTFVVERALSTKIHGSGINVAINNYNGFSFVGGLIYKKESFNKYNTDKHDGSIYSQMYMGLVMIASGCTLFTVQRPLVLKDLINDDGSFRWSYYRDGLPKKWSEYREMDGGLPSVGNVLISAMNDALGKEDKELSFRILKRIYSITYPFWIIQYKKYGSLTAALGLIKGINPVKTVNWNKISMVGKIRLYTIFLTRSIAALLMPIKIFDSLERGLQKKVKKSY